MYSGKDAKVIVEGFEQDIKIVQAVDDNGRPYIAAGCNSCDMLGHVIYTDEIKDRVVWSCPNCDKEFKRPKNLWSSAINLDSRNDELTEWVAGWLVFDAAFVEVGVSIS